MSGSISTTTIGFENATNRFLLYSSSQSAFDILLQVSVWVSKFSAVGPAFNVILMLKVNLIHDLVSVHCTRL